METALAVTAWRAVPTALQGVMKPLFQIYIPNLKYSLFLRQMSEQAAEHTADLENGTMTRAELARQVVDSVENRFGELNFDNLFWNRTIKSAMQLIFRSATYKLGSVRELSGAAGGLTRDMAKWPVEAFRLLSGNTEAGEGKTTGERLLPHLDPRFSWFLSLAVYTAAIGIIGAKLLSGKYPWEWAQDEVQDAVAQPGRYLKALYLEMTHPRTGDTDSHGKPVRVSLPTYWKDVEHATSSPGKYVLSSLSSTVSKGIDIANNEDYFGNYVYNPNADIWTKLGQAGKYAFPTPFVVSSFQRGKAMGETKSAWLGAFGFPRAPADLNWTPAERLANDFIKAKEPRHTPKELEQWRKKREALERGELSPREAREYAKRQRGEWLQRQLKRPEISYANALEVYKLANEHEKQVVARVLREKRRNLMLKHRAREVQEAEQAP